MRNIILIISFVFLAGTGVIAHPLHVSVINISISNNRIECKINTFVDDWETAYFHYFGKQIDLKLVENHTSSWFNTYLENAIKISLNNEESELEFNTDSIYFNDLSMTLELHAKLNNQVNSLYIYNALLTDIFADQTNLMIFSIEEKETGIKFDYKKRTETLKLK